MKYRHDLTQGSITGHIVRMTPPMAAAFIIMMSFNVVDTWFVSRLGTIPLAAMGFTFPVMMVIHSVGMGLGMGASSCVSRAIGEGSHHRVRRLATDSLVLGFFAMTAICALAFILMPRILDLVRADAETRPLAGLYLRILLPFVPFAALPMIANNAIRATGDTLRPSLVMAAGALLNVGLDPLLIFGWGPIPRMGIAGAAWATGMARTLTLALSLWIMHKRCNLLTLAWDGWRILFKSWKAILNVALPACATNLLMPVTAGIITRLVAGYGDRAVAAIAAGQRIEFMAYVLPIAMGTVLAPLIGQNWGAGRLNRVRTAWVRTNLYGIGYGLLILLLAIPLAPDVAGWFSDDPLVVRMLTRYIRIMLAGALLLHSTVHTGFAFHAVNKPLFASVLMVIRLVVLLLPLAFLGSRLFGLDGVFLGMAVAHTLAGAVALVWFGRFLARVKRSADSFRSP